MLEKINPRTRDIIILLGVGVFLTASVAMPGLPILANAVLKGIREEERKKDIKRWRKYNLWRLRQTIKRLYDQKIVEIIEKDNETIVVLTNKGRKKFLKYNLENMMIKKSQRWDGRWRLIIYDIGKNKKHAQELFRKMLVKLKFLPLQKSVYLYPYDCSNEIEFLREYYDIGKEVIVLTVGKLEEEQIYRDYFGL